MTKELAIRVLTGDVLGTTEQTQEAVKIAVEALSEPSGKDPIEREAVVEILHEAMQNRSESEEDLIGEIVCKVDLLPSTKPEIIRCKDCKYWREHSEYKYMPFCGFNAIYTKADDFCSRAERRKNEKKNRRTNPCIR